MDDALVSAAMGCGVALGARSSAWLQQLLPTAPPLVSVRVPPGQNRVARSGVDLRRRESLAIHIVKGLPVLTPFATLTDCAAAGGDPSSLHHELARMAAAGDALRSLPLDDFLTATGRLGRQPGSAVLRAAHCGWTSRSTDRITCCRHSRSATGGAIDWSARRSGTWSGSQPPWWTTTSGASSARSRVWSTPCCGSSAGRPERGRRPVSNFLPASRSAPSADPPGQRPSSARRADLGPGGQGGQRGQGGRGRQAGQGGRQALGSEGTKGGRTTSASTALPRTSTCTCSPSATAGSR